MRDFKYKSLQKKNMCIQTYSTVHEELGPPLLLAFIGCYSLTGAQTLAEAYKEIYLKKSLIVCCDHGLLRLLSLDAVNSSLAAL